MKEEQQKNRERNGDGKTRGWGEEGIWRKKLFAGKLGTDKEKAIGSIANVNASFFQFENRWS